MVSVRGLATGIGSLPYRDAGSALDLIFKYLPEVPFWPQLPKRDGRESMVAQFSEHLPCLKFTSEGLLFDDKSSDRELEKFYDRVIARDVDYFKIGSAFSNGFYGFYQRLKKQDLGHIQMLKCQITGPFTFAAGINGSGGLAILHDEVFMQAMVKGLAMKALWQIKVLKEFNKKVIMFMDEPYLGSFGSAYTALNRENVIKVLEELSSSMKSEGILTGVHCCANTDWSMFTQVTSLDIISFDAFGFLDRLILYSRDLANFLKRGGILCWGIVPTQEFDDKVNRDLLINRIQKGVKALIKKGLDKDLIWDSLMLSPSCGLGTLDAAKSEDIFALLQEISAHMRKT
jgi:methionine synthase II (cobalamin-independent)